MENFILKSARALARLKSGINNFIEDKKLSFSTHLINFHIAALS